MTQHNTGQSNPYVCSHCGSSSILVQMYLNPNEQNFNVGILRNGHECFCAECEVDRKCVRRDVFDAQQRELRSI